MQQSSNALMQARLIKNIMNINFSGQALGLPRGEPIPFQKLDPASKPLILGQVLEAKPTENNLLNHKIESFREVYEQNRARALLLARKVLYGPEQMVRQVRPTPNCCTALGRGYILVIMSIDAITEQG